jgi:hypothetical protein
MLTRSADLGQRFLRSQGATCARIPRTWASSPILLRLAPEALVHAASADVMPNPEKGRKIIARLQSEASRDER